MKDHYPGSIMVAYTIFIIFLSATVVFGNFSRYFIIPGSRVTNGLWTKVREAGNAADCCLLCDNYPSCTAVNIYMSTGSCRGSCLGVPQCGYGAGLDPDEITTHRFSVNLTRRPCELLGVGQSLYEPYTNAGWISLFKTLKDTNPTAKAVATQTSVYLGGGAADRAIDGNTDGDWSASSCTHTADNDPEKWWMVEFQTVYSVTAVVIWNRIDSNIMFERLRDLTVYVAASSESLGRNDAICAAYTGPPSGNSDNPIQISCQRTMFGRFLKIHKATHAEALTLCEVEIIQ